MNLGNRYSQHSFAQVPQENMVRPQAEQGTQAMGYHNLDEWAQKNPEAANQKDMLTTGLSKLAGGISKAYSKIKSKIK